MKKAGLIIFAISTGILFFSGSAFAQQTSQAQKNASASEFVKEPPINFQMVDANGNEIQFLTSTDEINKMEENIRAYEKLHGITDRTGKVYFINEKYEVISVKAATVKDQKN